MKEYKVPLLLKILSIIAILLGIFFFMIANLGQALQCIDVSCPEQTQPFVRNFLIVALADIIGGVAMWKKSKWVWVMVISLLLSIWPADLSKIAIPLDPFSLFHTAVILVLIKYRKLYSVSF